MNMMERRNTELIKEFDAYIREHPEFAEHIPNNAVVIMQLEGDEEFNKWSLDLAKGYEGEDYPIICVKIKRIRPARSRIEELELCRA